MAHHQQQQPQSWDRWQHHNTAPDYEMMDHMTPYDPRTVPSTTSLQLPTISAQYTLPTTYADSPVTPMSASSYGSPSHFGNYGHSYYQTPSAPTSFAPLPLRSAHRPTAPPTPPLEDDRGMRLHDGRMGGSLKSTLQRSPSRRGVSQVKSESGKEPKEIKTCPVFVKEDRTLQYESHKPFDVLLKKVNSKKQLSSGASTPVSMASPASEEVFRPRTTHETRHNKLTMANSKGLRAKEALQKVPLHCLQCSFRPGRSVGHPHAIAHGRETICESMLSVLETGYSEAGLTM